jgi:hypothetical protein
VRIEQLSSVSRASPVHKQEASNMPSAKLIQKTAIEMGIVIDRQQAFLIIPCVETKMLCGQSLESAVVECIFGTWIIQKQ